MQDFTGKVAVVTGAASGIGKALAEKCAAEGMKLALADIEAGPLEQVAAALRANGTEVLAVRTDVSKSEDIEALARQTVNAYGAVHLLFNNAGVGGPMGSLWEAGEADWNWVLGVNLWSIIHAQRVFVPLMLSQDSEGHIVNTASLAGLVSYASSGIYQVSKHAVVSLSEVLYHELALRRAKIRVSVLCPAWVQTRITESERNRPADLTNPNPPAETSPEIAKILAGVRYAVEHGKPPQEIAEQVFAAIRAEQFYIITHDNSKPLIEARLQDIIESRNPSTVLGKI